MRKGSASKTHPGRKDFTTKRGSKYYNRRGHRQSRSVSGKRGRPYMGGKTRNARKTRKAVPWAGWSKQKPSAKQRTAMYKRCPKKCFLGPKKSFPVCKKNTCKVSSKGLWAALIRAKEWGNKALSYKGKSRPTHKRRTYKKVANKAERMLKRRGFKVGKTQKSKRN